MKHLFLALSIMAVVLTVWTCNEPSTPPTNTDKISLSLVEALDTRVTLKLSFSDPIAQYSVALERDGAILFNHRIFYSDTTFLDTALVPNTLYKYKAFLIRDSARFYESKELRVTTVPPIPLDTSSHSIQWERLYFGDGQSSFYDVTVINDTCAYAVGEIYVKDSTGKYEDTYNAAKWDGKKWQLIRIMINSCGTQVYKPFAISCAYGLNPSLVYFGAGVLGYYDGKQFFKDCSQFGKWTGSLFKIWSQNTSTQWLVGSKGWTCRKDQAVYTNIPSGTTRDLTDVYGNAHEVWAVGGYSNKNEGIVLLNKGSGWEKIDSLSNSERRSISSVWCDDRGLTKGGFLVLAGRGIWFKDTTWKSPPSSILGGNLGLGNLFFNGIVGTRRNDVIAVGDFGIVLHYNGSSWKFYPELLNHPQGRLLVSVGMTKKNIFIVGFENDRGIIIHGKRN